MLTSTTRNPVSQTPPSAADPSMAGVGACVVPSSAHGPPKLCHDRTASIAIQPAGNTRRAASGASFNRRRAARPQGSHSSPRPKANTSRPGPATGSSQYSVAMTNPAPDHQPRMPASRCVDVLRSSSKSGTKLTQANHHQPGAGRLSTGNPPADEGQDPRRPRVWQHAVRVPTNAALLVRQAASRAASRPLPTTAARGTNWHTNQWRRPRPPGSRARRTCAAGFGSMAARSPEQPHGVASWCSCRIPATPR